MATTSALKKLAYQFITTHRAAALSTVDNQGNPHVAPVFCVVRKDLSMYFSTRIEGRKFTNLIQNPAVAMTFVDEANVAAIQLSGKAERIENLKLEQSILYDLARQRYQDPNWPMPTLKLFEQGSTIQIAIIKVTPTEMTYADFATPETGKYKAFFQRII